MFVKHLEILWCIAEITVAKEGGNQGRGGIKQEERRKDFERKSSEAEDVCKDQNQGEVDKSSGGVEDHPRADNQRDTHVVLGVAATVVYPGDEREMEPVGSKLASDRTIDGEGKPTRSRESTTAYIDAQKKVEHSAGWRQARWSWSNCTCE